MIKLRYICQKLALLVIFVVCTSYSQETTRGVCDFETDHLCGYTQDRDDDFDWTKHSGRTISLSTGPSTDHTFMNSSGHYLYIEASPPRESGDTARLSSQQILFSRPDSKQHCILRFWYHMYGNDIGELNVYTRSTGVMSEYLLWSKIGNQQMASNDKWLLANIPFILADHDVQVVFEGLRVKGYDGDIALDDIYGPICGVETRIIKGPGDLAVTIGTNAVLPCIIERDPNMDLTVTWNFNGDNIDPEMNTSRYRLTPNNSLVVINTNKQDRGTYTCRASTAVSYDYSSGSLTILSFDEEIMDINEVITLLSQNTVTNENVTEVASYLAEVTNDTTNIDATGLEGIAIVLESIANVQSPSSEVTSSVVDTIDNILNIDDEVFREAVDQNAPTRILRSLEEQLTALQKQGVHFTQSRNNIDVKAVQVAQASVVNGIGFASIVQTMVNVGHTEVFKNPENIPINKADTSIALPPEVITRFKIKVNDTAIVPATFILYQNGKLFQSKRLVTESTSERRRVVGTRIITASIEGIAIYDLSQEQPVVSTYLHTEEGNENRPLCVFWDFDLENGRGDWSNEGCLLMETTGSDRTVCHCDHLTSFAVLIDVHGQKYSLLVLDVLSIVGCFISITALLITLVTYLATKSLRSKTPKKVLICLSFTLLCLYVVFASGVDRTNTLSGCACVAALLHYLTLSSVCWMGVEAVNLYLLIVKVFNADVSHFMLKAAIAAWGGPLIPVLIVLAADYTQYVNEHHCFMKPSYWFYYADLLLIFIILAFNVVVFILVLHKLTCGRKKNIGRSSDRDKKQSITRALNAIAICAILGLTWVFGFLTIVENRVSSLAFQVLFCLFNSLQGLLIFVLFCVRLEEARNVWKRWFGCSGKAKYDIANTRSIGTSNLEAINFQPKNVELISKSQDKASNGQNIPLQPESVELLSTSEDQALNGENIPLQSESVEILSTSEDKASNGQKTPLQAESVELLSTSEDQALNGQKTPLQAESVELLSTSEDQALNGQKKSLQPESVEQLGKKQKEKTLLLPQMTWYGTIYA